MRPIPRMCPPSSARIASLTPTASSRRARPSVRSAGPDSLGRPCRAPARRLRSLCASRVVRGWGIGPAIIWMASGASLLGVLTPLAEGPVAVATLMVFLPQLIGDGLQTIEGVGELSLIQGLIPDTVLGRVNATLEVISHGVGYPVGALLAAFVAEQIGLRGAITLGWAGMAASILFLVFSPLPRVRAAAEFRAAGEGGFEPPIG